MEETYQLDQLKHLTHILLKINKYIIYESNIINIFMDESGILVYNKED